MFVQRLEISASAVNFLADGPIAVVGLYGILIAVPFNRGCRCNRRGSDSVCTGDCAGGGISLRIIVLIRKTLISVGLIRGGLARRELAVLGLRSRCLADRLIRRSLRVAGHERIVATVTGHGDRRGIPCACWRRVAVPCGRSHIRRMALVVLRTAKRRVAASRWCGGGIDSRLRVVRPFVIGWVYVVGTARLIPVLRRRKPTGRPVTASTISIHLPTLERRCFVANAQSAATPWHRYIDCIDSPHRQSASRLARLPGLGICFFRTPSKAKSQLSSGWFRRNCYCQSPTMNSWPRPKDRGCCRHNRADC